MRNIALALAVTAILGPLAGSVLSKMIAVIALETYRADHRADAGSW